MQEDVKQIIDDILSKSGFSVTGTEVIPDESGPYIWYHISTNEPRYLIGKNGETIQALNHLVRKIIETKNPSTLPEAITIMVDVNRYQQNRIENLKNIAHMMAERARFFKSSIEIDPMTAFERKIIHTFLESKNDIKTESAGEGPNRHIVIKYIGSI